MTLTTWIILVIISLIFSALFSGTEIAYITSDRVRVELDVKRGGLMGRIINRFYSDEGLFISTILVGNNIVLVIYGMGAAYLIEDCWLDSLHLNQAVVLMISTLISTGVILITGEFFPKTVFRINPYTSLKVFALPIYIFYMLLLPVSLFTSWLSKSLMKLCGIRSDAQRIGMLSVRDLNQYLEKTIDEVNPDNAPVENEVKIFHNALDFSTTHLRDCMLPRNEIVAVSISSATRDTLVELFTTSGRSKIVVYGDDIDNVLGYIHVSELFDPDNDWKQHLKPVVFAPGPLLATWRRFSATSPTNTTSQCRWSPNPSPGSMNVRAVPRWLSCASSTISTSPRTTATRPSRAISSSTPAPSPPRARKWSLTG